MDGGHKCAWLQGRLSQTSAGMLLGCLEVLMEDAVASAGKLKRISDQGWGMRTHCMHRLQVTCALPFAVCHFYVNGLHVQESAIRGLRHSSS